MRPSSRCVRQRSTSHHVAISIAETLTAYRLLLAFIVSFTLSAATSAQQPSAVRTPATTAPTTIPTQLAQQASSSPQYAGEATRDAGESSSLRPSMPQEAWTGAANVQFAGYAESNDRSAPSVYSAGANQRVGSVTAVPPGDSQADPQPKERRRIPIAEKTGDTTAGTKSSSTIRPLLSMVFSLLIVLGLFFGMVWVYRKSSNGASHSVPKQVVQVLGRTPLAARQNLVLVRFGSKLLLISMAQGETRTLGEITDPLEVDQLAGLCESNSPNSLSNSFRNILSQGVQA